jgi:hypothetical protein
VFPLYSIVFARLYYRGPLLGVDLAVTREYKPPLVNVCLPCDIYILEGFSRCFSGFFLVGFGLFRLGVARALYRPLIYNILGPYIIIYKVLV